MGGLVWFDKIFQAFQGSTSFIADERGWVIFEYSHVFRSGGSLMYFSELRSNFCKHYRFLKFIDLEFNFKVFAVILLHLNVNKMNPGVIFNL
jgi:hypothetical protein